MPYASKDKNESQKFYYEKHTIFFKELDKNNLILYSTIIYSGLVVFFLPNTAVIRNFICTKEFRSNLSNIKAC